MTGADNISVVLYCYLRTLSVKVSRDTVHRLLSTPLGGGMRGISDALDALHIKNEVFRLLSRDYFLKLETPFITMLEVDKKSFCVVTKKDDFIVEFINGEGGKRHVKVDKFLQHWTGTVLLGEPTEATPNEQFYIMRNIVFYLLRYRFIIALLFVHSVGSPNKTVPVQCCRNLSTFTCRLPPSPLINSTMKSSFFVTTQKDFLSTSSIVIKGVSSFKK